MHVLGLSLLPDLVCCSVLQWQYLVWQPHGSYPRKKHSYTHTATHTINVYTVCTYTNCLLTSCNPSNKNDMNSCASCWLRSENWLYLDAIRFCRWVEKYAWYQWISVLGIYIHTYMYRYACTYMCTHMCTHVYMYMYVYTHTYAYTCVHACVHTHKCTHKSIHTQRQTIK